MNYTWAFFNSYILNYGESMVRILMMVIDGE